MATLADIRKRLDADNPLINKNVNGVDVPVSHDEREEILDEWAANVIEVGNRTLREKRNALLVACDWTQVSDAPVDAKAWAEYRQALRDLPANTDDPENPVWPEPPK